MLFRIAEHRREDVLKLAEEMTADELDWYTQFYRLEPWWCVAEDHRTALVAYTQALSGGAKGVEFNQFLPQWEPPRQVSYEEGMSNFRSWASRHNKPQGAK